MSDETLSGRTRTMFGVAGAGALAAAVAALVLGATPSNGGSTYFTARFHRAGQGLDPGKSDVKIRGITVGTVQKVKLDRDGRVSVRMRVDKGVRLAQGTTARIEPVSVFGPKDLVLDLGKNETTGPYLKNNADLGQGRDPVELSDTAWPAYKLTKAINPDELATILRTFSAGLDGQGPALRRALSNGAKVIDATDQDKAQLKTIMDNVAGLAPTLASRGGTVNQIVGDVNRISPVIYDRPDKINQILDGTSELTGRVGDSLRDHGGNIGNIIDGAGDAARVVHGQQRNIPVLLDDLNGFFTLLVKVIKVPGPKGTMIANVVGPLPLDLCKVFIDVCPVAPKTTVFDQKANVDQKNDGLRRVMRK
ncbi:MlaD family protein [Actinomadura oligospora]|uniref:MlaD family protein n=1 Tax=Actinomadura oligospora TaxID=111804 RepID=UPI0004AF402F|nr:MlaD family protein [Actinomadura oligospora]